MVVDPEPRSRLKEDEHCLLRVMHRHFWVRIQSIGDDGLHTTFPGTDYPIPGMEVELEIHEEEGFTSYVTEVIRGPSETAGGGIVLKKPECGHFHQHRGSIRVSTDLTVQLRDQVHVRHYTAALLNLSSGGALVRTDAPLELDTVVELNLSLPQEAVNIVLATVIHLSEAPHSDNQRLYGFRFINIDPSAQHAIGRFVYKRIQEMYPKG